MGSTPSSVTADKPMFIDSIGGGYAVGIGITDFLGNAGVTGGTW